MSSEGESERPLCPVAPPKGGVRQDSMLTVIVPVYNEEGSMGELVPRLQAVASDLGFGQTEILMVSDGSTDRSEAAIAEAVKRDARFKGVFLSRNFGHQAAISTGLSLAKGDLVACIDGDLQDPPEVLPRLVEAIERGADVAYGVRRKRKEGPLKRLAYRSFYRLLKIFSAVDIPLDAGDFCCMTRRVVAHLVALPERTRFLRGLRAWVGYPQTGVEYERQARSAGEPKYTFRRLVGLAYDGLFSFSVLPVRIIQVLGFVVSLLSLVLALVYFVGYFLATARFPVGFATLVVSIWFLGGVQLLFLGVIGEYVWRTCEESRQRPVALVREVLTHDDAKE